MVTAKTAAWIPNRFVWGSSFCADYRIAHERMGQSSPGIQFRSEAERQCGTEVRRLPITVQIGARMEYSRRSSGCISIWCDNAPDFEGLLRLGTSRTAAERRKINRTFAKRFGRSWYRRSLST